MSQLSRQTQRQLVENQEFGRGHQPTPGRRHLLLTSGERARILFLALFQDRKKAEHALSIFFGAAKCGAICTEPAVMMTVRLCLLGRFRIERADGAIRLATRKAESLLAYLALDPQPHAREKLAALFWGDSPDPQARQSLRVALASMRGQLGQELVLADQETMQLNPHDSLWVDAAELRQAAEFLTRSSAFHPRLYRFVPR